MTKKPDPMPTEIRGWSNTFWKALAPMGQSCGLSQHETYRIFLETGFRALRGTTLRPDGAEWKENEDLYLKALGRSRDKMKVAGNACASAFAVTVQALEDLRSDFLGPLHMEAGGNADAGQFFTPSSICDVMAEMAIHDGAIPAEGPITVHEPAVGSGAMLISVANVMSRKGISPSRLRCEAWDVDEKCVWATYIQTTLCGIPCVVVHGNTLSMEKWGVYGNPMMSPWLRAALLAQRLDDAAQILPETPAVKITKPKRTPVKLEGG